MIDWNAISALTSVLTYIRDTFKESSSVSEAEGQCRAVEPAAVPICLEPRYQVRLGQRIRAIRTEVLKLNTRQMANAMGIQHNREFEDCEAGDDEFPQQSIHRLEELFFFKRRFLEEGQGPMFQHFPLCNTTEGCLALLKDGFKPHIFTELSSEEFAMCLVVFNKDEAGFNRVIVSDVEGNFASCGGGKQNMLNLIKALFEHYGPWQANPMVVRLNKQDDWKAMLQGTFYRKDLIALGYADYKAQDCLSAWSSEVRLLSLNDR